MGSMVAVKGMLSMNAEAMAETQRIMTTAMVRIALGGLEHHVGDLLDQPRGFRAGNDHEQADEEHQGSPFHLMFQHLHDVHPGDGQQQQGADQGRHARPACA